jgi:hypothetical protein
MQQILCRPLRKHIRQLRDGKSEAVSAHVLDPELLSMILEKLLHLHVLRCKLEASPACRRRSGHRSSRLSPSR